jgi:hypothetical protein
LLSSDWDHLPFPGSLFRELHKYKLAAHREERLRGKEGVVIAEGRGREGAPNETTANKSVSLFLYYVPLRIRSMNGPCPPPPPLPFSFYVLLRGSYGKGAALRGLYGNHNYRS